MSSLHSLKVHKFSINWSYWTVFRFAYSIVAFDRPTNADAGSGNGISGAVEIVPE